MARSTDPCRARLPRWLALVAALPTTLLAQDPQLAAVRTWFATPTADRGAAPGAQTTLRQEQVATWRPLLHDALRDGSRALGGATLATPAADAKAATPHELTVGTFTMPYVLFHKGERPAGGWPLFVCLHGGGGNAEATGPHAWDVNTGEWRAQQRLAARVYPTPGLYFVPRMADDRQGRWWFDHNQQAFDDVVRQAILFHEVDPDRVFLLGISEGGYGAIRFAAHRPDRFAGCNGMAAAEPLDTSPPENMRNVAVRIDIGERDTMFDRIGLAQRMGARLDALHDQDPTGYEHVLAVQPGRGHGIDYAAGPRWLADKVRNPRPSCVVWTVQPFHTTVPLQRHWLALPKVPTTLPLYVKATLRDNRLAITAEVDDPAKPGARVAASTGALHVRLDDALADLEQPIVITVNGKARGEQRATRTLATMVRTLEERGCVRLCFPAELVVALGD